MFRFRRPGDRFSAVLPALAPGHCGRAQSARYIAGEASAVERAFAEMMMDTAASLLSSPLPQGARKPESNTVSKPAVVGPPQEQPERPRTRRRSSRRRTRKPRRLRRLSRRLRPLA